MTALDDELAIEAWEGRLAPLLDAHGAAVIAALRGGVARPPWPDALRTPAVARLVARHDPAWAARARTLARWSLAARLEALPVMIAARRTPATAAGLAARHQALVTAAASLGHPDARSLVDALYGARPRVAAADVDDADGPAPMIPALPLPTWAEVRAALAEHAGVDARAVAVLDDARAAATVLTTAGVVCAFPPVTDLGALTERLKLLQEELAAQLNEQSNRTLFTLTLVTVLALPINIVAGLFGMNVGGIPLAEHPHGFWVLVGLIAAFTVLAGSWAFGRQRP